MNNITYHIMLDGEEVREIESYNPDLSIVAQPENGYIMREKLDGFIICQGDDYTWLKEQEQGGNKFKKFGFNLKKDGVIYWVGEFLMTDVEFDADSEAKFKPVISDDYSELLKNWDKEINVLENIKTRGVKYQIRGHLEILILFNVSSLVGWDHLGVIGAYTPDGGGSGYTFFPVTFFHAFAREYIYIDEAFGLENSWVELEPGKFGRSYTNNYGSLTPSDIIIIETTGGNLEDNKTGLPINYNTLLGAHSELSSPPPFYYNSYLIDGQEQSAYADNLYNTRSMSLFDIVESIVQKADTINNYPLGLGIISELTNTFLIDNSDFKFPNGNPATVNNASPKIFFDSFFSIFKGNVYWILENGVFYMRRVDEIANEVGLDLSTISEKSYENITSYKYDRAILYNREFLSMNDTGSLDWQDYSLIYDFSILEGGKENLQEYNSQKITTDIEYLISNQDYNLDGFLMVKTNLVSGPIYEVQSSVGVISLTQIQNEKLSPARLRFDFNRRNMPMWPYTIETPSGYTQDGTAETLSKSKQQQEIKFIYPGIIDYYKSIKTDLGNGRIKKLTRNIFDDEIKVELVY